MATRSCRFQAQFMTEVDRRKIAQPNANNLFCHAKSPNFTRMGKIQIISWMFVAFLLTGCGSHSYQLSQETAALESFRQDKKDNVISVGGQVVHPGKYPLVAGKIMTVSEALLLAGGMITEKAPDGSAAVNTIRVLRLKGSRISYFTLDAKPVKKDFDILNPLDVKTDVNFPLQPGDTVYVSEPVR